MKLVLISDTHERHEQIIVPYGDVLIHAGDMTMIGEPDKIRDFANWFKVLPHPHKIFIAGNHDKLFETALPLALKPFFGNPDGGFVFSRDGLHYLENDSVTIDGVKFYGSPWTPAFGHGWAFNASREKEQEIAAAIPTDTDVLITHGPPYGILDQTLEGDLTGSRPLGLEVETRVRPLVHVFGHIHEGFGMSEYLGTKYCNASVLDRAYRVANKPWVIEI